MRLREGLQIKKVIEELGQTISYPIKILGVNASAISITENPVQHDKSKHMEINRQFIREKFEAQVIRTEHVPFGNHAADIFTEPVSTKVF